MANASIRYGVSLRKRNEAVKKEKKAKYECDICGKQAVKREGTSIWKCKHCGATFAGGAYSLKTSTGSTFNRIISQSK